MRRLMVISVAALLALALCAPAYAANAAKELESFGMLLGYAGMCAEKSGVQDTDAEKREGELFGKKFVAPYAKMGAKAYQHFMEGVHVGMAAGGMDQGAQCDKVLSEVAATARAHGLSGSYWLRVQKALGGSGAQASPGSAAGAQAVRPGFYRTSDDNLSDLFILLKPNHTGTFQLAGEEGSNPFDWELKDGKLLFRFRDSSLPAEQRNQAASVKDAEHFVLDGATFERDADCTVASYSYAENGYEGDLTLIAWGDDGRPAVEIATVNLEAAHTCDLTLTCAGRGAMLVCRDESSEDKDAVTTIKELDDGSLSVDTTMSSGDYCGNRGSFTGKYTPIR